MSLASPPTKTLGGTRPLRPIGIDAPANVVAVVIISIISIIISVNVAA